MTKTEIILILIGIVAYTIKAMQPDGFLNFVPSKIKLGCFPCIAGWFSLILVILFDSIIILLIPELFINPFMFLFIGASGYVLFKFLDE